LNIYIRVLARPEPRLGSQPNHRAENPDAGSLLSLLPQGNRSCDLRARCANVYANANCEPIADPKGVTPMQKPLREAINDVVIEYVSTKLQRGEPVDVAFMAREMSLPLIDMVMEQDEKHQGPLLAHII
jgi:DNA-binding protein Fis